MARMASQLSVLSFDPTALFLRLALPLHDEVGGGRALSAVGPLPTLSIEPLCRGRSL